MGNFDEFLGLLASNPDYADTKNPKEHDAARFIRATKGNIRAAVTRYVEAERFFKERGCDSILEPDRYEYVYGAYCPHANFGFDKQGRPIYIERTGMIDSFALLKVLTPDDLLQRHVRQQERAVARMAESTERRGELVEDQICILDLKSLSMKYNGTATGVFKACIKVDTAHYPERLKKFYIINAPWIFKPLWAMIRPWLDPVTKEKFAVLGSNYQDALLKDIEPDQLPVELGGTAEGVFKEMVPLTDEQKAPLKARVKEYKAKGKSWSAGYGAADTEEPPPDFVEEPAPDADASEGGFLSRMTKGWF